VEALSEFRRRRGISRQDERVPEKAKEPNTPRALSCKALTGGATDFVFNPAALPPCSWPPQPVYPSHEYSLFL
jgi:hypothetical protein